MARKKKSKNRMNAIDKYLKQKKYSCAYKENKTVEKEKLPKVLVPVIPIVKFNDINQQSRRSLTRKCNQNTTESISKNDIQIFGQALKVSLQKLPDKYNDTEKSINFKSKKLSENECKNSIKESVKSKSSLILNIKSKIVQPKRQNRKNELNKRTEKQKSERKSIKIKPKKDENVMSITKVAIRKRKKKICVQIDIEPEECRKNDDIPIDKQSEINKNISQIRAKRNDELNVRKKKRKIVEEPSPDVIPLVSSSCNCEDNSSKDEDDSDYQASDEINPTMKKYQPYMERIETLTSDVIKKYILDNQQYYIDLEKEAKSKFKDLGKKSKKNQFKNSFKCNPFNSVQQIAMFCTLREIFNIPRLQFKECRNFFTVLMPEISCHLFAETFGIKVALAPRLIKKLYPNPVCPV